MTERDSDSVDDFPYKNKDPSMRASIGERFRALMHYVPRFMVMTRSYTIANAPDMSNAIDLRFAPVRAPMIMALHARDYEKYNLISDYFIEYLRIRAYRGDDPSRESLYDYWRTNRARITEGAREYDVGDARETLYREKMEVGTFRPTVVIGIFELARKYVFERARDRRAVEWVLNPCAGWGDRLIGAMAYGVRGIVDVDPNQDLGPEYERIEMWAREQRTYQQQSAPREQCAHHQRNSREHAVDGAITRRRYFAQPFEDVPESALREALRDIGCERGEFDLALIAPPYFDLEVYVPGSASQSVERYPTFAQWYSNFLIPLIFKSGRVLRKGGVIALIINQAPDARTNESARFLRSMIHDVGMGAKDYLHYLGVVSYAEVRTRVINEKTHDLHIRSPQPIWLWKKV